MNCWAYPSLRRTRVWERMLQMRKIDIAALREAAEGLTRRSAAVRRAAYWSAPESSWATMDASPRVMTVSVVLPMTIS